MSVVLKYTLVNIPLWVTLSGSKWTVGSRKFTRCKSTVYLILIHGWWLLRMSMKPLNSEMSGGQAPIMSPPNSFTNSFYFLLC